MGSNTWVVLHAHVQSDPYPERRFRVRLTFLITDALQELYRAVWHDQLIIMKRPSQL